MIKSNRYKLSSIDLMDTLDNWDSLMNFRVHLIACGGTALTLLKIKDSTKDIDFIVPEENEYQKMNFTKKSGQGYEKGRSCLQFE